jgi:membrane fusion protein, multidrug efflux system
MEEIKQEEPKQNGKNHKRKAMALGVFIVVVIIGMVTTFLYIQYKNTHITTDDAFVEGNIHTVASKVPGTVKSIYVSDNIFVKKGELLVEIDSADYDVKVTEAGSGLDAERAKLAELRTRVDVAKKQIIEMSYGVRSAKAALEVRNADLRQAETDLRRAENLLKKDAISKDRYDKTKTGYDVAIAQVNAATDQLKQTEASIETQNAVIIQAESLLRSQESLIKQKEAVLSNAELYYGYTKIYSPADGYVTKKSVESGNQIQQGQPIMAIVPLDDIWITANYKETQLEKIKPGQKVKIKVDISRQVI